MKNFLTKFKIPTLLGLGVILIGIGVGVFLSLREQIFLSGAAPSQEPQNIKVSNIEDSSISLSWQTSSPSLGFVTFGQQDPGEQIVLDDRDNKVPQSHQLHYVTLKNLLPKTSYQYKIVSGKIITKVFNFTTASVTTTQTGFNPVIGSVLDGKKSIDEGIAFLSISDATIQSSLVKNFGNFLIPLSSLRKQNLSDIYSLSSDTAAKVTIIGANGEVSAVFNIKPNGVNLPPLILGQNIDLTTPEITSTPTPNPTDLSIYDLNKDGKINSADYSLAQKNNGKKISSVRSDLTTDRIIDDKYLKELTSLINNQNSSQ